MSHYRRYKPPVGRSCAVCAAFVDPSGGRMEPLGKDKALVFVCIGCCDEVVPAKFGPELAYEPSGMIGGKEISAALERKQGSERYRRESKRNSHDWCRPTPRTDPDPHLESSQHARDRRAR